MKNDLILTALFCILSCSSFIIFAYTGCFKSLSTVNKKIYYCEETLFMLHGWAGKEVIVLKSNNKSFISDIETQNAVFLLSFHRF